MDHRPPPDGPPPDRLPPDRLPPERPLPDMNDKSSRAMWIVGYVLLAFVVVIAIYAFIGTAA